MPVRQRKQKGLGGSNFVFSSDIVAVKGLNTYLARARFFHSSNVIFISIPFYSEFLTLIKLWGGIALPVLKGKQSVTFWGVVHVFGDCWLVARTSDLQQHHDPALSIKCQYNCTRDVSWCQVHSSHIHVNHKIWLDYNNSKHRGKTSLINKYMKNPAVIKCAHPLKIYLFTRSAS